MSTNINNPKAIAEKGEEIYKSKYKDEYEKKYPGKFVAINILDGSATLGETASRSLFEAKAAHTDGLFHLIRVGHTGAFEVGLAYRNASPDRLHR